MHGIVTLEPPPAGHHCRQLVLLFLLVVFFFTGPLTLFWPCVSNVQDLLLLLSQARLSALRKWKHCQYWKSLFSLSRITPNSSACVSSSSVEQLCFRKKHFV